MSSSPEHIVAIFGGAVAGAEAAEHLSRLGIKTVVFEQNPLPFGKIEDGLPFWHIKLRDKEEEKIIEKLNHPNVHFVPSTRLGNDVQFNDLVEKWNFSAILLATGAWRDRPIPIDGIDAYIGKGLTYQNPFFQWFNHAHDANYSGPTWDVVDDTLIIGGGLASIDVAKAVMMQTTKDALSQKGIHVPLFEIEKKGPADILAEHKLTKEEIGLKGCTLVYRRHAINMPITPIPEDADERRIQKAMEVRQRMIDNLVEKFLFKFVECHMPVDKIISDDRLSGIVFQKTKIEGDRVIPLEGEFSEIRSAAVISSIGSVPEMINGIPMKGSTFAVADWETGQLEGYDNVYLLGNAVTGQGNIKVSRTHGNFVGNLVREKLQSQPPLTTEQMASIFDKVKTRQAEVGYDGDLLHWATKHTPVRLENLEA
ncbi:MAG: FAD-dependent oxidoreductase [Deferribacteres bacterium]|nr:FAD-dependent oxidoreductase [candidate division KSB1 bacterium]MCB9501230.1 FAD-dependent oxidoreductase [Deferribacteres bacterium]